jgi:hypothetical protein
MKLNRMAILEWDNCSTDPVLNNNFTFDPFLGFVHIIIFFFQNEPAL